MTHKWGDAKPDTGDSVTIPHLIDTFYEWGQGVAEIFWTDERFFRGENLAYHLLHSVEAFRPNLIVYTPIPSPGLLHLNIEPKTMSATGAKSAVILFDHAQIETRTFMSRYADAADLCVNVDGCEDKIGRNFLSLWAARTSRLPVLKDIELSFVGARAAYPDRVAAFDLLKTAGIDIHISGGRSENRETFDSYFDILDRSKVTLNFSRTVAGSSQLKARVIEALSCGCCLVENENEVTSRYLRPGIEYIPYSALGDLPGLLAHLRAHPELAGQIGANARSAFNERLSAFQFWQKIRVALDRTSEVAVTGTAA